MSLTLLSIIYIITFTIHALRAITTNEYDWDIDQFMYFGNRLLNGELVGVTEFDDKLPILQYLFAIPAYVKSTSIWVLMTLLISIYASYLSYKLIVGLIYNSGIRVDLYKAKRIALFAATLYLCLIVCIFGSLNHINTICSSLNLIAIYNIYKATSKDCENKRSHYIISALSATVAISVRPYLLFPIIFTAIWGKARSTVSRKGIKSISIAKFVTKVLNFSMYWLLTILLFGAILNLTPYLLTGNLNSLFITMKLNATDYISHNIFERQYLNIGKNPIIIPFALVMIVLPIIRIIKGTQLKGIQNSEDFKTRFNLEQFDLDILYFSILSPLLLEEAFLRRHFFAHYFNLFSPYLIISTSLLLAMFAKVEYLQNPRLRLAKARNLIITIILIISLITDKSITSSIKHVLHGDGEYKKESLIVVSNFLSSKDDPSEYSFLFPEDNYYHWKLSQSRHHFPQAAVYKNIRMGIFDKVINANPDLEFEYILPRQKDLCNTLKAKGPKLIFTKFNDFSYKCLSSSPESYRLLKGENKLEELNLYVFQKTS